MPYKIQQQGNKHCVVKESGEVVKCHPTHDKALAHMRALYANVEDSTKELLVELTTSDARSLIQIKEAAEGYDIISVSTAAIEDREGETFTVEAIDYDIQRAKETGKYPEYRVFHSPLLGIGQVTEMRRVGIFAVEKGKSYTDAFSLAVCKELSNHDGKWRTSRGFRPVEVEFSCPSCGKPLGIQQKHMLIGFRCPQCNTGHNTYKGAKSVRYMKAETFDITATDVPAVPMTGMAAFASFDNILSEVKSMNKNALRQRLLDAGLEESVVDARLSTVTDEQLKEFDGLPFASVLKEFDEEDSEQVFTLDEAVLDAIADRAAVALKELLESAEIEIDAPGELKEYATIDVVEELKESIERIEVMLGQLLQSDDQRLKELNTPAARQRLRMFKSTSKKAAMSMSAEDDEEDEEDMEETANGTKINKETARWLGKLVPTQQKELIVDGSGNTYGSLTEMLVGGNQ